MNYPYSQTNRMEEPHSYVYTPFQGEALLQSYQSSRLSVVLRRIATEHGILGVDVMLLNYAMPVLDRLMAASTLDGRIKFRKLVHGGCEKILRQDKPEDETLNGLAQNLEKLTTLEPVSTLNVLHPLIAAQLTDVQHPKIKVWLDRLVQRFEVTKKIYDNYLVGFRTGEGGNTSVRLYWLFALSLCLFYTRSSEIKYLNTLLKICDLLCSVPEKELYGHIPVHGLQAVLATELVSVQLLAEKKGVSFAND
jgi:hypothetical protein